jgi:L-glyceraldehyde 3-phosphate reductase
MALSWVLRHEVITSAIVGIRSVEQLEANVAALGGAGFSETELREIDHILAG